MTRVQVFDGVGIPFGPLNDIKGTFEHPQVLYREMVQTVNHPTAGVIKLVGIPVKYSDTKPSIRSAPPLLGQHTESIRKEFEN